MILEELGRNPPEVTLDHIVKDLLSFFNGFECLHEAKRVIERKCDIKKEPEHKCWSEDYIKQAWKETIKEDKKSSRRRHWARVIMLQIVKSFVCDTCKQNAAQKNRHAATHEQDCETTPNSEDRVIQSETVLESVGAAAGDEQLFEGKKVSEVSKLSDDSGVVSGSQLLASSTDESLSPPEVNPVADSNNTKTKSAALNEDEDTSVNNCEQQNGELFLADVHDKENTGWKNGGISQRAKGNSEDISTQRNAEPQQTEQVKDTVEQPPGAESTATKRQSTDNTGSESLLSTSGKRDDSKESPRKDDGKGEREGSNTFNNSQTVYIRIPFSVMSGNESPSSTDTVVPNDPSTYKLIDRVPNLTEIRKRKSYAVLYNNQTRNAAWGYEILNRETLKQEVERKDVFKEDQSIHPFYRTSKDVYLNPYHRGHLAAANNHRWCREACDDTFLMSNMTPQHEKLNTSGWSSLEKYCRREALKPDIRNVHVFSGPLYQPTDDKSGVVYEEKKTLAVPTHFFKVIIKERIDGTAELECYMMPNEEFDPDVDYTVSIEDIERASGLIFRESSCSEGETESLREVTWTGHNDDDEPRSVTTKVNINGGGNE